jgi:ABC-type phosphate transport system substrate-binding protein
MKPGLLFLSFILLLLSGCSGTGTPPAVTPQVVRVQYTAAGQPWLVDLTACAAKMEGVAISAEQRVASTLDAGSADIMLRLGVPQGLSLPSFQVGEDQIVVIVQPQNPVSSLTREQLLGLFIGQITNWSELGGTDQPVQLWVLDAGEDIQAIFGQTVLDGLRVPPGAHLAADPGQLRDAVAADPGAVGIISKHYLAGNPSTGSGQAVRVVRLPDDFSAALQVPVLAITPTEPQGAVRGLLACLQK